MVSHGRFQRARKSFGSRRFNSRGSYNNRFGNFKKTSYRKRLSIEKKYFDKTYQSDSAETLTGGPGSNINNGVTYISNTWGSYTFGSVIAGTAPAISNDMFKGLDTGTTARTRVGNKVRPIYIKGAFTFTAALVANSVLKGQGGEILAVPAADPSLGYLRTSYRMIVVKDLQVNSADPQVRWNQVMDTSGLQAGIHSELNVDNMGRFIVVEDKTFTVDADNPQKTVSFQVGGNKIGAVRYNGAGVSALTDKGLYVVWAAFVMGHGGTASATDFSLPSPVGHSRLCFTDD